jgi:hypothetical protein
MPLDIRTTGSPCPPIVPLVARRRRSAISALCSGTAGIERDNRGYAGVFAARCATGENAWKHAGRRAIQSRSCMACAPPKWRLHKVCSFEAADVAAALSERDNASRRRKARSRGCEGIFSAMTKDRGHQPPSRQVAAASRPRRRGGQMHKTGEMVKEVFVPRRNIKWRACATLAPGRGYPSSRKTRGVSRHFSKRP